MKDVRVDLAEMMIKHPKAKLIVEYDESDYSFMDVIRVRHNYIAYDCPGDNKDHLFDEDMYDLFDAFGFEYAEIPKHIREDDDLLDEYIEKAIMQQDWEEVIILTVET